ncbi:hypothetical protein SEA_BUTTON_30 [Gordonia phage Button]|nr:hypothetical protein SEA_BUTTON_30 [Gordonia phage Button]
MLLVSSPPPLSVPDVVSTSSAYASSGVITMPTPSGVQAGDVLVMFIGQRGSQNAFTPPSGWTKVTQTTFGASSMHLLYKVAGASEPATFTVNPDGGGAHLGVVAAVRRASQSASINNQSSGGDVNSNSAFTTTPVAVNVNNAVVLHMGWLHSAADIAWSSVTEIEQVVYPSSSVLSVAKQLETTARTVPGTSATTTASAGKGWMSAAIAPLA